jgi:hypothetical protein
MRVQLLILATLAAACGDSNTGCSSPDEDFEFEGELTEAVVADILEWLEYTDRGQITCEDACAHAYQGEPPFQGYISESTRCSFTLDAMPGAEPEAIIGEVSCAGRWNPAGCV